jgi:4-hydroxy 2-oxovalerate aldolase
MPAPWIQIPPENVRILDVTLRDGGYLNDWAFTPQEMCELVRLLDRHAVDYVEVGYVDDASTSGLTSACPPEVLEGVRKSVGASKLAAMMRATAERPREALSTRHPFLDLIRIPTHAVRVRASLELAGVVREFGLDCSINLTNISIYTEAEIGAAVEEIRDSGAADIIYLADSRGALGPDDVGRAVESVRDHWDGPLGFHAHDNLGLALQNATAALNRGCSFIDGSVDGLGQGVGNASLQGLLRLAGRARSEEELSAFADRLTLPERGRLLDVYQLTGAKNISQDWVPELARRYGRRLPGLLGMMGRTSFREETEFLGALRVVESRSALSG